MNTLTEQDAERLEKLGFRPHRSAKRKGVSLDGPNWYWYEIDWPLLGILIGMAQEKEVSVYISAWHEHYATELRRLGRRVATLVISINATPRQIFDALLEVLSDDTPNP